MPVVRFMPGRLIILWPHHCDAVDFVRHVPEDLGVLPLADPEVVVRFEDPTLFPLSLRVGHQRQQFVEEKPVEVGLGVVGIAPLPVVLGQCAIGAGRDPVPCIPAVADERDECSVCNRLLVRVAGHDLEVRPLLLVGVAVFVARHIAHLHFGQGKRHRRRPPQLSQRSYKSEASAPCGSCGSGPWWE